jgi:TctA family transporter
VLGPRFEENFRRSMLISRGDILVFLERPISAFFLFLCAVLILAQIYVRLRKPKAIAALPDIGPESASGSAVRRHDLSTEDA